METLACTATTAVEIGSMYIAQLDAALLANLAVYRSKETADGDGACTEYFQVVATIRARVRELKKSSKDKAKT
jgi:head-tail adaptor